MLTRISVGGLLLFAWIGPAMADAAGQPDAMAWLKKIAAASRQVLYQGVIVYQHGNSVVETSRITHVADSRGEYEKLETMDGPAREIIRSNDQVTSYLPDSKTIVIERRSVRRFPSMLPEQLSGIAENYAVWKGELSRVAGHDCQIIELEPKDNLRYGHRYCAELGSGLALRALIHDESGKMVESFAFTQIRIGAGITKDMLRSRYAGISQNWRVDKSALEQKDVSAETGWSLKQYPAGFRKLTEIKRMTSGRPAAISHIVYSDGLAAVSVFIEPLPKLPPPLGPSYQGAVNIYVRSLADHMLTVMGETPARTVKQIAESLNSKEQ